MTARMNHTRGYVHVVLMRALWLCLLTCCSHQATPPASNPSDVGSQSLEEPPTMVQDLGKSVCSCPESDQGKLAEAICRQYTSGGVVKGSLGFRYRPQGDSIAEKRGSGRFLLRPSGRKLQLWMDPSSLADEPDEQQKLASALSFIARPLCERRLALLDSAKMRYESGAVLLVDGYDHKLLVYVDGSTNVVRRVLRASHDGTVSRYDFGNWVFQ